MHKYLCYIGLSLSRTVELSAAEHYAGCLVRLCNIHQLQQQQQRYLRLDRLVPRHMSDRLVWQTWRVTTHHTHHRRRHLSILAPPRGRIRDRCYDFRLSWRLPVDFDVIRFGATDDEWPTEQTWSSIVLSLFALSEHLTASSATKCFLN